MEALNECANPQICEIPLSPEFGFIVGCLPGNKSSD
jgi:hypothetical protein